MDFSEIQSCLRKCLAKRRVHWCVQPVTAIIMKVLITVAIIIGSHCSDIKPKHRITPTPAGTKKNPRLCVRKSANVSTCDNLIIPHSSDTASNIMPIILLGTGAPVNHTINSPAARKQKRTAH